MNKETILQFELLGSFSHRGQTMKAGRKALSFLQYLIVHHERSISADELIEEFWPERSNAPANALRRMLCKVRDILGEMFPEGKDLLQTLPGCYVWNPLVTLELDTEQFEQLCREAGRKTGEQREKALLQAVSLYRGDFLAANDSNWTIGPRQYYRALYLDACKTLLPLLEKKEKWLELLSVCEQAYRVDFTVEDFTIFQMRALMALGQPEQAMERYGIFRDRLQEEFQTEPSERMEQVQALAAGLNKKDMGVPDVFRLLTEEETQTQAFFCTFDIFRSIVALERRHLARSKGNSTLVIVRLGGRLIPGADARRLERILMEGLRAGDPVARLEAGAYILLLTGADAEGARLVMGRLDLAFHKTYHRSNANISYHVSALKQDAATERGTLRKLGACELRPDEHCGI